jgi:hypothetical protein
VVFCWYPEIVGELYQQCGDILQAEMLTNYFYFIVFCVCVWGGGGGGGGGLKTNKNKGV